MQANVDQSELRKFSEMAARWWDPQGPMRPLHEINPARLVWIDRLARLSGKRVLVVGWFGNKAKNDQAKDQANLYNIWLRNYQNTSQNLMAGAQAQGWNPYGPKTSTSQSQSFSSGGGSFSNRPVITGEYQGIDQLMRNIMTGRLSGGSSLPQGYAQSGIRGINESFEGADQAARNMAARRRLSGEQTYTIASPANRARAGQIADFRANLPLLERQMQKEDIGLASGLQAVFRDRPGWDHEPVQQRRELGDADEPVLGGRPVGPLGAGAIVSPQIETSSM